MSNSTLGISGIHAGQTPDQRSCSLTQADLNSDLVELSRSLMYLVQNLEHRLEEQRLLYEVILQANAGVVLGEILNHVYDSLRAFLPYDRIGLSLLDPQTNHLRSHWMRSSGPTVHLKPGYTAPINGSSLEKIIESGKPRILNDLEEYLAKHPHSEATRLIVKEGMRSSLTCPLIAMGKPIGFLFFSSMSPNIYQPNHVHHFVQIANELSVIVEKGRLYDEVQLTNRRLSEEIKERKKAELLLRKAQRDLKAANRELTRLASHDWLTGIANRRFFDDVIAKEWRRCQRNEKPVSLILIDVDHFKKYNDTHGHLAGDDCLRWIAAVLSRSVRRPSDLVARYGGEEFAVILAETDLEGALRVAENIRAEVENQKLPHQPCLLDHVTISLGVASVIPLARTAPSLLITRADAALYQAKCEGRNRVVVDHTNFVCFEYERGGRSKSCRLTQFSRSNESRNRAAGTPRGREDSLPPESQGPG